MPTRQEAAQARAARAGDRTTTRARRWHEAPDAAAVARAPQRPMSLRAAATGDGLLDFNGYASVTNTGYDMWDWAGPYTEEVAAGAFGATLARDPDVAFLLNHGGMTLARTVSGTCQLSEDSTGLLTVAQLDPRQSVVRDIQIAMERGDLTEMSFAFLIVRAEWSPDWMTYRITEIDIDRGDVSIVNYGANPATSASLRSRDIVHALDVLDEAALRQARDRIDARLTEPAAAQRGGISLATAERLASHDSVRLFPGARASDQGARPVPTEEGTE